MLVPFYSLFLIEVIQLHEISSSSMPTYLIYVIKHVQESIKTASCSEFLYLLERLLGLMIPHIGQMPCSCPVVDPRWSFSSQLLTVPFLWELFPHLKEVSISLRFDVILDYCACGKDLHEDIMELKVLLSI